MRELERSYEREIDKLKSEKEKLEIELAAHKAEHHQKGADFEKLVLKVNDLENRYKNLDKKKRIGEINEKDALAKISFLEEEANRLKSEKERIQSRDVSDLKREIDKLMDENLKLKNYNDELERELELIKTQYSNSRNAEKESYEAQINILRKELSEVKKGTLPKDTVKNIIKNANQDVQKRNEFYEDEIKRTREQSHEASKKLQDDVNRLMDELQKEEHKKITVEEKVKYYEHTIDTLDNKIDKLFEDIKDKEGQIREANARYSDERHKSYEAENREKQLRELSDTLKRTIEGLERDNQHIRKEVTQLKTLEWKIKEYEPTIKALEQEKTQLEGFNSRLTKDSA